MSTVNLIHLDVPLQTAAAIWKFSQRCNMLFEELCVIFFDREIMAQPSSSWPS